MKAIITDRKVVVVGLGKTGLSCVRYLCSLGKHVIVMDTREEPPGLDVLECDYPNIQKVLGRLDASILSSADEIVLSPGVPLSTPEIQCAVENQVLVRGDIDLFSEAANAPVVAITGSNGKSTVTTLLGDMAHQSGLNVGVGGNLGIPALELLDHEKDLYVLELSSFQLETTHNLNAESAVLLNLSEDHMDRYANKMAYLQAKQRIFKGAKHIIVNDDDVLSSPLVNTTMNLVHFGVRSNDLGKFSILKEGSEAYLAKGFTPLVAIKELSIRGEHNYSNALAALALGDSVGLDMADMISALKKFKGLSHRCQFIRSHNGVDFVNDSKGTNPGAVVTALTSLAKDITGKVILIAGGDSKGADLSSLREPVKRFVKSLVLIGVDAEKFETLLDATSSLYKEGSLEEAVRRAYSLAQPGDVVLLSPACASFDMFRSYEHRGEVFNKEVMSL